MSQEGVIEPINTMTIHNKTLSDKEIERSINHLRGIIQTNKNQRVSQSNSPKKYRKKLKKMI